MTYSESVKAAASRNPGKQKFGKMPSSGAFCFKSVPPNQSQSQPVGTCVFTCGLYPNLLGETPANQLQQNIFNSLNFFVAL